MRYITYKSREVVDFPASRNRGIAGELEGSTATASAHGHVSRKNDKVWRSGAGLLGVARGHQESGMQQEF